MVKHQPLQVYERQLCLSCITGIYGCRWKRYQRSHDDTTKWELLWSFVLLFTFGLLLLWSYFWWEAHNDYSEYNWFLYNRSGVWSDGTAPILATTAAGFTYVTLLMVLALCHVAVGQQLNLHWLHKIGVTVALLTTVVGVISVTQMWGYEWDVVPISLLATGPFLHIGAVAAVTALSWIVAGQVARAEKTIFQVVVVLLYFSVLLALYTVPLYVTSPCIMDPSNLKQRPDVIGHQGAAMIAPENTMWSFQRALQMNVTGLETDVTISLDGVPFLMHDATLRRTTDVQKVFPERQWDDASSFNWTDLRQLNAGHWFLKDDPFGTARSLSPHEKQLIGNQSVCSLEQLLTLASFNNCTVVFKLRKPPPEHPSHYSWINHTLQTVLKSGIRQSLVFWTPEENRAEVRKMAPGLVQSSLVKPKSPEALERDGISAMLLRYNQANTQEIRNLSQNNINLTLYTVNAPWLYSVLWCSGVPSVSSEAPHILNKLPYPIWLMKPDEYCVLWVTVDLVSFAVVIAIFILQKYRSSGIHSYNPEQIMLSAAVRRTSRDLNVMKEKLIFSEVENGVTSAEELYSNNGYNYYSNQGQ
ncbi:glycerophosphodiester phosphodiesterase domain-containing protein 5 isoform X2 [Eucyclogobius newberryi]|uniref:glycerophosphodiester phosphodiesterase domain-containing protein 5 isoform X2 n=1 Tax=Eucyclogobius newberryi TaxID=166745 RepID=UPI003B5AAB2F